MFHRRFHRSCRAAGAGLALLLAASTAAHAQERALPGFDRDPGAANPDNPDPGGIGDGDGTDEPCPNDRFFVHVPTWAMLNLPLNFQSRLQTDLDNHIAARPRLSGTKVTVEAVLDSRPGINERADGHRRFWTISTDRTVPGDELCAWVDHLRNRAQAMGGADLYVGRECVAAGLGSPGAPDWPLELMGKPAAPAGPPAPIAVIDTGFKRTADWRAPGIAPLDPKHPHGQMIREAIRQLTSHVGVPTLLDYRAMGSEGTAPLANVARAIDAAVFDADGARVINLSLGWPPELERRRALPGCGTLEDPIGEAVRYTLAMAHMRDAGLLTAAPGQVDPNGPTAVMVAGGNRPTLFGQDVTPYYAAHHRVDFGPLVGDCSQPSGDGLFYPAQWARRDTCFYGRPPITAMRVTPVGATDHRDERSPLSAPEMTPVLVAPGTAIRLGGQRWSGSSIATAYASAAVSLELAGGGLGRAAVLAVYTRGTHLPHLSGATPVRRLTFATPHTATTPRWVGGGPRIPASGAAAYARADRLSCLATLAGWFQGMRTEAEVAAVCPAFLTTLDRFSAGDAGPQPPVIGCPECYAPVDISREAADVYVTLTSDWDPSTTTLSDPYLVVSYPDGYESWIALPYDPTVWKPGEQFTVEDVPLTDRKSSSVSDLVAKGSISLVMMVEQYGKASTDVSLVTIK